MLEMYLTIFRSVKNFVFAGDNGKTPAMRLGFANYPLTYEDILWPGEQIPNVSDDGARGEPSRRCVRMRHEAANYAIGWGIVI